MSTVGQSGYAIFSCKGHLNERLGIEYISIGYPNPQFDIGAAPATGAHNNECLILQKLVQATNSSAQFYFGALNLNLTIEFWVNQNHISYTRNLSVGYELI